MADDLVVTPTTRDAGERALARLTNLTHHAGQPLGVYERHVLADRVLTAAARYGHRRGEQRDRVVTALAADAILDKLAGLEQTDTGTLNTVADTVITAVLRAYR